MRAIHSIVIPALLLCLPYVRAEELAAEFQALKQKRVQAIRDAVAPADKKFTEAADLLAARAIKEGKPELAERIKRERLPQTGAKFRANAFSDTWWKLTEGPFLSMYRIEANGVIEEVSYYGGGPRTTSGPLKWRLLDETHAIYGETTLTVEDNILSRDKGVRWVPSDKATFEKFSAAKDEAGAKAAVGK